MLLHALQQFELSLGTHKIVLRILDFIISVIGSAVAAGILLGFLG